MRNKDKEFLQKPHLPANRRSLSLPFEFEPYLQAVILTD